MEIAIKVKYFSDNAGAGQLRATFKRRRATVGYPHHLPSSLKNWEAARELADRLERSNGYSLQLLRRSSVDSAMIGASSETFHFLVHPTGRFDNEQAVRDDALPARIRA